MIARLVRHHTLFNEMPKLAAISLVTATFAANLATFMLARGGKDGLQNDGPWLWLQLLATIMAAGGMLLRGASRRSAPWFLGLPIDGSALWRSHYLALLAGLQGLLLVQMGGLLGFLALMSLLIKSMTVPWEGFLMAFVSPALVMVFIAGLVAAYRSDLADMAESDGWVRFRWLVLVSGAGLVAVLSVLPPVVGVVPAAAGTILAGRSRRRMPPGLRVGNGSKAGPLTVAGGAWDGLAAAPRIHHQRRLYLGGAILDQLFKIPYRYYTFLGLFIAFFGAVLGGWDFYGSRAFPETLRFNNFFITIYLLFALTGEFTLRLHKVDFLPVSRRSLLLHLMLPGVLFLIGGYGAARLWQDHRTAPQELVRFQCSHGKFGAAVTPSFHDFARKGDHLEVAAPWGETHTSVARHPVPRHPSPWALQSPYLTDDGATSREFLAWQLSRAVEHVYGRWIEPEELDARYIQTCDDGSACVPRGSFTVARDYGLKPRPGGPVSALLLGPMLSLYLLVAAGYFALLKETRSVKWARVTWWVFMGGLFVLHILQVFSMVPFWNKLGGSAMVFATARKLGELGTPGHVLAHAVAVVAVLVTWRLACRAFQDLEAPR
jgi:hypothetical protein